MTIVVDEEMRSTITTNRFDRNGLALIKDDLLLPYDHSNNIM
jgi:hypothetical protein